MRPASCDGEVVAAGTASYEAPTEEEFFLPGSGAALGMSSADLEASRTATWDDNMATIDDVEPPGALRYGTLARVGPRVASFSTRCGT